MEESKAVMKLSEARRALAEVRKLEDAKEMVDQAAAMLEYAKRKKLGEGIEQDGREIKIRAERKVGEILQARADAGEMSKPGPKKIPSVAKGIFDIEPESEQKPLSAYGITHPQAHRYRKNAEGLTDQEFEDHITETREKGKPLTAQGVYNKADAKKLGYVGSKPATGAVERDANAWFTPMEYIEKAHAVLGEINLDPFSSSLANKKIKAAHYYDVDHDALCQPSWTRGPVFMNPPYGRGYMVPAIEKFLLEYDKESFDTAIVLTNNATETSWFTDLLHVCDAVSFTQGRIAFISPDNKAVSGNTRGQAFFYFGDDIDIFQDYFGHPVGNVLAPYRERR